MTPRHETAAACFHYRALAALRCDVLVQVPARGGAEVGAESASTPASGTLGTAGASEAAGSAGPHGDHDGGPVAALERKGSEIRELKAQGSSATQEDILRLVGELNAMKEALLPRIQALLQPLLDDLCTRVAAGAGKVRRASGGPAARDQARATRAKEERDKREGVCVGRERGRWIWRLGT